MASRSPATTRTRNIRRLSRLPCAAVFAPRKRSVDSILREAIAQRRLVSFLLDGRRRIGEPPDYGIVGGVPKLFFSQTGGETRSGRPSRWPWAGVSNMSDFELL